MIQLVKGTKDIYGAEVKAWQEIEGKMRRICETFGIGEIRTPAFEFTELFARGVGETTDIVQKEMYTFTDDGDRSLTLRPEGTSGAAHKAVLYFPDLPLRKYTGRQTKTVPPVRH